MIRHRTLILLLVLFFAFALRVLSLDAQSMWRDEIDTFCFALDFWEKLEQATAAPGADDASAPFVVSEQPRCQPTPGLSRIDPSQGVWPTLRALLTLPGWNGPLYTVAVRPWIGLTGYSPFALRYSSLFFGVLAVPLTYVLGRRLLGEAVGLIGATLVAFSPHLVWYSQEAKMYAAVLTWGLLAIYGLRRAVDGDGGRWWGVLIGAATLALYHHILAALLIPLLVILGVIWWPRTREHWRGALVALACLTLPYLPLLAWQLDSWLSPSGQATLFATQRLDVMLAATLEAWGGNFVGEPWATQILATLAFLALCGLTWDWLTNGGQTEGWRESLVLLAWAGLPLVGIWAISARQPIFVNRYMIWAAPAFYLLAAAGAVALVRQAGERLSEETWVQGMSRVGRWVGAGLFLLLLIGNGRSLLYQATQSIKPDFRAAADCIAENYRPGDLVIFHLSYMQHNFDFYYGSDYEGWGAPAPGDGMSEADLDFYMRTRVSGHATVWLVLSEAEMWDPRGLVKRWLDNHAAVPPEECVFAHVSVYRYQQVE